MNSFPPIIIIVAHTVTDTFGSSVDPDETSLHSLPFYFWFVTLTSNNGCVQI